MVLKKILIIDGVYLLPWRGDEYLITYKYHQVKTSDSDQIIVILLAITTPNNRGIKIKKFIKGVAVGSGVARGIEKLWEIVKEIF